MNYGHGYSSLILSAVVTVLFAIVFAPLFVELWRTVDALIEALG